MSLREWLGGLGRRLAGRPAVLPSHVEPGSRVRLRNPLASSHRVWVPAGAAGIVVGWDTPGRRVSVELDSPRTVVTVPWSWTEEEPPPALTTHPPSPDPPRP
jgi:hypothetical protein